MCSKLFFVFCFIFFSFHLLCSSAIKDDSSKELFGQFIQTYSKSYHSKEIKTKFDIFSSNLKRITEMNQKYESIGKVGPFGVTKFSDLTPAEFKKMYLTKRNGKQIDLARKIDIKAPSDLPDSFDWNSKGAVTPVYNQGECGSCWAFSAVETIESQWFLAGNSLISLSPQQVVDCDKVDLGCEGGDTPTAYAYVINATGLETQNNYPYTGENQQCAFSASKVAASISSWGYITTNKNETEMQYGLYAKGPLSVCVEADSWQFYVGGIISDFCGDALDHCVQITGFQTMTGWDLLQYPVWNVRNSWGEDWGYQGYLYIERGNDLCGIGDEVTIPIV